MVSGRLYSNYLFQLLHTHFLIFRLVVVVHMAVLFFSFFGNPEELLSSLAWSPIIISVQLPDNPGPGVAIVRILAFLLSADPIVLSQETTNKKILCSCLIICVFLRFE